MTKFFFLYFLFTSASLFHHERRSIPSRGDIRTITRGHYAFASGGRRSLFVINYNWCFILA
ncbi:hypothetical protein GCWU000325_00136 [Alloprevotella tannerae ATCC 51259]|uniref:Uncharacterized protein n=1 Tax=Alloprevotella tannerae ATCC 51259 TaxID=626522 RepID=C9LD14_9BACT|nr:hypothetical protein GCWU000325_00136 [Alloprevotella tannerae ATCC 51259]